MIKHLMQNTAELTERWRKQIKLSALFFDRAFESSRTMELKLMRIKI
jgi:hypothetical protein